MDIENFLSKIDIVDVVGRVVNLKRQGTNWTGLCPFHKEKTPSFSVSQDKQIFKCFGCWHGWNAIKFVMEYEKLDFLDALKQLWQDYNIDISQFRSEKNAQNVQEKKTLQAMMSFTQKFFQEKLSSSPEAKKYLASRGLDEHIISHYWIWFAPASSLELVNYLKSKWFDLAQAEALSLVKKLPDWYHTFLRNRIIFPIYNHIWTIIGFAGRSFNWEDPKYLNGSESELYKKSQVLYWLNWAKKNSKSWIIVVEGYMDVIGVKRLLWEDKAVASCWTALTPQHLELLKKYSENIIFCFDSDEAGLQACKKALGLAYQVWVYPNVLMIPSWYKDLDELAKEGQKDINQFVVPGFDWFLKVFWNMLHHPVQRKWFLAQAYELFSQSQDYSIVLLFLQQLADFSHINIWILESEYTKFVREKKVNISSEKKSSIKMPLAQAILAWGFFAKYLQEKNVIQDLLHLIVKYNPEIEKVAYLKDDEILQTQMYRENQINLSSGAFSSMKNYLLKWFQETLAPILPSMEEKDKLQVFKLLKQLR